MNEQKLICRSCGGENNATNTFCMNCGERITPPPVDPYATPPDPYATPPNPYGTPENTTNTDNNPGTDTGNIPRAEGEVVSTPPWYNQGNASNPYQNTGSAYTPPPQYTNANKGSNSGLAIASMVCGIISYMCCYFSFFVSIPGLILGIISLSKKQDGRGMAIAGVILSAISIAFYIIVIILVIVFSLHEYGNYWYDFL